MTIDEKATAIYTSALTQARDEGLSEELGPFRAINLLATACALLTSTSKEEREQGKTMVRRWKNGNSF